LLIISTVFEDKAMADKVVNAVEKAVNHDDNDLDAIEPKHAETGDAQLVEEVRGSKV
jgi:hypothetical protein